jgi:hypothetical protein
MYDTTSSCRPNRESHELVRQVNSLTLAKQMKFGLRGTLKIIHRKVDFVPDLRLYVVRLFVSFLL